MTHLHISYDALQHILDKMASTKQNTSEVTSLLHK